jgi:hypothetical protein
VSSPVDLVLSRLDGFKLRQNGRDRWRACCPAHGGSNPSALSIGEGDGGAVLLKCWQGCSVESIASALGLDLTDLFPPRQTAGYGASAPARRRLLNAGQALELLDGEATLVLVCASDLARGEPLDEPTRERLMLGAARIALMREEVSA